MFTSTLTDMAHHRFKFFSMFCNLRQADKFSTNFQIPGTTKGARTETKAVYCNCYYVLCFKALFFNRVSVSNNAVLSELNWKWMDIKGSHKHPFKNLKTCQVVKSKLGRSIVLPFGRIKFQLISASYTLSAFLHEVQKQSLRGVL